MTAASNSEARKLLIEAQATSWIDRHGDVWRLGDDGLLHTPETQPFSREHVEKKWGPLRPVVDLLARLQDSIDAAEAASNSESAALATNGTNRGASTSETANGPQIATQRPAPVDSGAIGRLNETEGADLAAAIKDSFYEARDQGRTMHQAAEDPRIAAAVDRILREHTDRALAEVADQIESAVQAHRDRGHHQIVAAMSPLPDLVRAARQEAGR